MEEIITRIKAEAKSLAHRKGIARDVMPLVASKDTTRVCASCWW